MFRAVVSFCALLALAKGQTTPVNSCLFSSATPPLHVYIDGCEQLPCGLVQGQDAVVNIIFRIPYTIHRMRTLATAWIGPLPVPYDLQEKSETCNFLTNTYCPVLQSEVVSYRLLMPIEEFMPVGTNVAIEFRIQDDSNRNIMCLRASVVILPPINKMLAAQNSTITVEV